MDFKTIPLLDNYETTLAQEWDGQIGKIKVDDLPNVAVTSEGKFEGGFTTYIIVNPDKANFQLAEIDGYDAIEKTLNVINVNLLKGLGVNYNISHHNQKSVVRISNNFAFWKKLSDVLNSKADYGNGRIEGIGNFLLEVVGGNLKFKDKDNVEISLTDIAGKIGQDKKVSITGADEASFLQNKLGKGFKVVGNGQDKKVDVDYTTIDFSALQTESLNKEDFILLSNGKKAKIGDLFAVENDVINGDNKKLVTSDMLGGNYIVHMGYERLFYGTSFVDDGFRKGVAGMSGTARRVFRKKCLIDGTYRVVLKASSWNGNSGYAGIFKNDTRIFSGSINYEPDEPVIKIIEGVKKGDYIEIYESGFINIYSFEITGNIGRKKNLDVLE